MISDGAADEQDIAGADFMVREFMGAGITHARGGDENAIALAATDDLGIAGDDAYAGLFRGSGDGIEDFFQER